jgi:hypothetical protein
LYPRDKGADMTKYLYVIGGLSYISVGKRPNITYAANFLARFSS